MTFAAIAASLLLPLTAFATSYEEVVAMLSAAEKTPADIATAVKGSSASWRPKHVYALIDAEAPKEVISAAAAKAAIFYDGNMLSLDAQAAKIHATVPPQTIKLAGPGDFGKLFAFYVDVKKEVDAKKTSVPALEPQKAGELDSAYDKRVRLHQEEQVKILAPVQGKIVQTTFEVEIPATYSSYDAGSRCFPAVSFEVDLSGTPYDQWRAAMGGPASDIAVSFDPKINKTVDQLRFVQQGSNKHLKGTSKPVCVYPDEVGSFQSAGAKLKLAFKRGAKGEDWTAVSAVFVNARTGEMLPVKK